MFLLFSLFPSRGYGNILHTEPPNTSLNTTFSSLNELNRPSTFATLGIISGLEDHGMIHGEKKEMNKDDNEAKYFQREWQRLGLGGIGNKQNRNPKQTLPEPVAKENPITEPVVTPPVALVIEAPKYSNNAPVQEKPSEPVSLVPPPEDRPQQRQIRLDTRNQDNARGGAARDSRGRGGGRGRENRNIEPRTVTSTAPTVSENDRKPRGRAEGSNPSTIVDEPKQQNPNHHTERIEKPRASAPAQTSTRREKSTASKPASAPERSEGRAPESKAHVERVEPTNNRNNAVNTNNNSNNNHSRPANNGGNNRNNSNTNNQSSSRGAGGGRGFSGPRAQSEVKGHHDK